MRGYFERGLAMLSAYILELLGRCRVSGWIISMVSDGILAGVGGVLGFLPNISILFLALAFLEDSGYMARIAWVMNGTMASADFREKPFSRCSWDLAVRSRQSWHPGSWRMKRTGGGRSL